MNASDPFLRKFEKLTTWSRKNERAPHKPLLLLLALGLFSQGVRSMPYTRYEGKLIDLLREFGPARRSLHPEYPFWRLCNDGVWEVNAFSEMRQRISNNDIPRTVLRAANATGRFPLELQRLFIRRPETISHVAQLLLMAHFPDSLHCDILDAVGLSVSVSHIPSRKRDPNFRSAVLTAYRYRCAVCGLDLRIGNITVALEAAHIQWHQADGPDVVENGIALCSIHHKLFDLGAFTLAPTLQVLVSEQVHGTGQFEQTLLNHHGQNLSPPLRTEDRPHPLFIQWHRAQVFKERPRLEANDHKPPEYIAKLRKR
ncbi:phosphorothioated DNA-binding restriction endonuclease [Paraburkholderia caballeronis]|uniref:phosphorothioated DNA-binding restriction endonuclease n=1 Tax=Paraburkholderia caballeronis TaxID=416943 RepID=UPI0010646B9A